MSRYAYDDIKKAFELNFSSFLVGDKTDGNTNVSFVTDESNAIYEKSSKKRAKCIGRIISGKNLHDSTLSLVSSLIVDLKLSQTDAIDQVQELMMLGGDTISQRFTDRFNNVSNLAKYCIKKQLSVNADWPTPIPLKEELLPVDLVPFIALPKVISLFLHDAADRLGCPADFLTISLITSISAVVGNKVKIRPKQKDSWEVTANLWGCIVGRPASMKSPALSEALKFIQRFESEEKDIFDDALKTQEQNTEIWKIKKKVNKFEIESAVTSGKMEEALALMGPDEDQVAVNRKRYIANDATVEMMGVLLNENPNGILLFRDELNGFFRSLDKDKGSNDRAFYLEAWNGNGSYIYDRIGRGTLDITSTTVSIIGGLQPSKLLPLVRNAVEGNDGDDGFIQRFQLLVYPDPITSYKLKDKAPDLGAISALEKKLRNLVNWQPNIKQAHSPLINDCSQYLRFSLPAQEKFNLWFEENEAICRSDIHPALESHFSKYRNLVPRLALIFELIESNDLSKVVNVSLSSFESAITFVNYLRSHANRCYALSTSFEHKNAKLIYERFDKLDNPFTARDIQRKNWIGLTEIKHVTAALVLLEEHHYCKSESFAANNGGRPSIKYFKNPNV